MSAAAPVAPMLIGADGIDVEKIVAELQARVAEKRKQGAYDDARVARAEKHNLLNLQDDDAFLDHYLTCLRQIVPVDINDFEIFERRPRFAKFFIKLKKGIWGLLRFYTFRLWSQQNQTNALLLAAIEMLNTRNANRIRVLEQRVAELEARLPKALSVER
jgi:hypothetical protein